MNRIDWLIATGGNPCFGLEALIPILTPLIGETAAGIAGPALVGGLETAAGGAALGGITGGGPGAATGAELGGLTGAGIFGGGPAAAAAGLPATVGTTAGGVLGGTLGGVATGQNPLLTGAAGGLGGLGAGISGVAGGAAPAAPTAAAAPITAPLGGATATAIPGGGTPLGGDISQYAMNPSGIGPGGTGPVDANMFVQSLAPPGSNPPIDGTQPALAGASSPGATLSPRSDAGGAGGGGGGAGGGGGIGVGGQPVGNPGTTDVTAPTNVSGTPPYTGATAEAGGQDFSGGSAPWGSGIMNFLGNPSPLQLLGAGASGIGLISQLGNRNPYAAQIGQLQQQGTGAATMATALESPTFTGIMPPGVQQSIDQQKRDAKAAITQGYANAGMPGSSSEAEQIAASNARIDAQKIGIAQKMMDQASGYAGLAPKTMQTALADQWASDQQFQNALNRFVAALAGGRGGTTQPSAQMSA